MSRHATLLTSLAFVPLTLGLVGVGGDQAPLYEIVTLGLAGLLILAQLMMLLGGRSLAKGVVGAVMLPLTLALASYALPEYWVTLESWDAMSHGLAQGLTLEAWRPALLTTLSLILVAVLIATHSQSTLGGPLLLVMAVLLSAQGLLDAAAPEAPLLRMAAGLWTTLSLGLLLAGLSVAALPGWRLHAAPLRRALVPSLALVLAVLLLWYHQKNVTERELHGTVAAEARQLGQRLTREIQDHLTAVERFANVYAVRCASQPGRMVAPGNAVSSRFSLSAQYRLHRSRQSPYSRLPTQRHQPSSARCAPLRCTARRARGREPGAVRTAHRPNRRNHAAAGRTRHHSLPADSH